MTIVLEVRYKAAVLLLRLPLGRRQHLGEGGTQRVAQAPARTVLERGRETILESAQPVQGRRVSAGTPESVPAKPASHRENVRRTKTRSIRARDHVMRKLSEIIKEMACVVLKDAVREPSSEAAHAALLIAHVAWNRANGTATGRLAYADVLQAFENSNPGFWSELRSSDPEGLIAELVTYKEQHYGHDNRQLVVCGIRGDKVHVEWVEPTSSTPRGSVMTPRAGRGGPTRG